MSFNDQTSGGDTLIGRAAGNNVYVATYHTEEHGHPVNVLEKNGPADPDSASASDKDVDPDKVDHIAASPSLDKDPKDTIIDEINEVTPDQAFKFNVDGDQSPFPEVAACVPVTDDPSTLVNTFRMWFLLTIFVILFAGVNQFFSMRYPSLTIGYVVAQLLVFPIGKAWGLWLPSWRIGFGRFSFNLNPGKFTVKEHATIVICISLTASTAYGMGALVSIWSPVYWNQGHWSTGFGFLFLLTSQMLGFGLVGLARRWIVYPAALIWPQVLSSCVLFRALHEEKDTGSANGWTISRYRFFAYGTALSFAWFWLPDYLFTALSSFAFLTWIAPNNQKVNTIFGMNSGLGLLPISFDWTVITYAGQPLTTPFYITANCFAVVVIFYLFLSPILYYKNVWFSGYLPLLSSTTFDNTGKTYNVSKVLVHGGIDFNVTAYQEYSPMYISMSYSLSYALSFAAVTSVVVYTVLWNGKDIWARFKDSRAGGEDVHKRLMNEYEDVPDWWYAVFTVIILGLGILTIRYWPTELPVWGFLLFCFGMCVILIIPEGLLEGTTNQRVFLNIITELIAGYIWPGKPIAK
ncbi:Glutathione transporter 1 [Vanrija pseudolonga]|uniref:Glutathione transporter 1 n=1 Tax=Vanrija pseudolonga TaxID=143232 RepID=A0AAF1BL29_9TREE|nr:Glutathione transporter 1 [Vanrija pseudolonga]